MLIQCPECKKMISDSAEKCPKCGHSMSQKEIEIEIEKKRIQNEKIEKNKKLSKKIIIVGIFIIIIASFIPRILPNKSGPEQASIEAIAEVIKDSLEKNEGYTVTVDKNTIIASIYSKGLADSIITLKKIGADENYEDWRDVKDSFINIERKMQDVCESYNRYDIDTMVNVLNDKNTDNVLLSVFNGTVIYDAMTK